MHRLDDRSVLRLVQLALAEDIGTGDLSSESLVDAASNVRGRIVAREPGVLAGGRVATTVFGEVDRSVVAEWSVEDGARVDAGTTVASIFGPARSILTAERTALNFIQRMSGVATLTSRYVDAIRDTGARLLDTRKTIPAWRLLDKYAVTAGGGQNHRMGLYDMVMIKDNHIVAHGSISRAVSAVREYFTREGIEGVGIEVETTNLDEVTEAVAQDRVTRIMFDNFSTDRMRDAVAIVEGKVETEASGGITLESIRGYAETGVDFISVGALTHSAVALDLALDLEEL